MTDKGNTQDDVATALRQVSAMLHLVEVDVAQIKRLVLALEVKPNALTSPEAEIDLLRVGKKIQGLRGAVEYFESRLAVVTDAMGAPDA